MEIKEGMYVRTTYGRIYKIEKIETTKVYYSCNPPELQWQDREFVYSKSGVEYEDAILKASHNIIDLIEVGDIVNGERVFYINDCCGSMKQFYYESENPNDDCGHWNEEIETILTKEQYESMAYEVKK